MFDVQNRVWELNTIKLIYLNELYKYNINELEKDKKTCEASQIFHDPFQHVHVLPLT